MITSKHPAWTPSNESVEEAAKLVERANVCDLIERAALRATSPGGRPATGIHYSVKALLTAMVVLVSTCEPPSIRRVLQLLLMGFTDTQRARVGMRVDRTRIVSFSQKEWKNEYSRFHQWQTRALRPLDSMADLPARRQSQKAHQAQIDARTREERVGAVVAHRLAMAVTNRLIAASIDDPAPEGYRGDVVSDETIIHVAERNKKDQIDGEWTRAAVATSKYYRQGSSDKNSTSKRGHGIGVTAIVRVGSPEAMHKVVPLVTAIAIHEPTSGTPARMEEALAHHVLGGFDRRLGRGKNRAHPYLVTDMGYSGRLDYQSRLVARSYSLLSRFPAPRNTVFPLPGAHGDMAGPIQMAGDIYCPVAERLAAAAPKMVIGTAGLTAASAQQHDRMLAQTNPLLMGKNSRLRLAGKSGRPRNGEPVEQSQRIDLVCPAVQGRVRCPLKPASMKQRDPGVVPTLDPEWAATDKRCCSQSQVTVVLTGAAFRQFHPTVPPSSWEHTLLYESYRSMTERTFSLVKSPHVSSIKNLAWSPKREPYVKLIIAVSFAVANIQTQESWEEKNHVDRFALNLKWIEKLLGYPHTRIPPRT